MFVEDWPNITNEESSTEVQHDLLKSKDGNEAYFQKNTVWKISSDLIPY